MSHFFTTELSDPRYEVDGLRFITIRSNALKRRADLTLYDPGTAKVQNVPLVVLLHGVYGSHWVWALKAGVHKTCRRLIDEEKIQPMILAMPSDGLYADGSGYLEHTGVDFEKWIVEDVLQAVREQVPAVTGQSPVFITGFSMGGFGALRLGSKYPHLFRAFSGLSSITHFDQMKQFVQDFEGLKKSVDLRDGVLEWMVRNKAILPPFRFDCGVDDQLIEENRDLHRGLERNKIAHGYTEFSGAHDWDYWGTHIQDSLLFFNEHCQ